MYTHIKKNDPELYAMLMAEQKRQQEGMELIPSENITSRAVMEAMGSVLTNKYSEGYPGARYYGGNEHIDKIENLARDRAKKLFNVPYANVQPYSGSPANLAVYLATCEAGDSVLGQFLFDGGHLTHGWKANISSKFFKTIGYHVGEDGRIDVKEVEMLAKEHKPKLVWIGATAYPGALPFKEFAKIADSVGAYLVADISHISGLVVSGVHESPVAYAHIVTTTTHKTLRGPRGGIIMVTEKGFKKDPELGEKVDKAIMPGSQGGPHNHQTAAIAVALKEAATPAFRKYGKQIVANAHTFAEELKKQGIDLVSNGTENHLILMRCGKGRGALVEKALDVVGMTANKNTIPKDPSNPFYPSGLRMGTPSITTRGMKAPEMKKIAKWIARVMREIESYNLPKNRKEIPAYLEKFEQEIRTNKNLLAIGKEVKMLCKEFPAYK